MPNIRVAGGILILALSLGAQTDSTKLGSLRGVVKNSLSGAVIPRAHIVLGQYTTTAGADGKFAIDGIAPGDYRLTAEHPGFVMSHQQIQIAPDAGQSKTDAQVTLIPTGGIAGRVVNAEGEPVESARVQVSNGQGTVWSRTTDEYGQFRAGGLAPGRYRVLATRADVWGGRPEIRTDGTVEHHDATTYYPGTVTSDAAGSVVVRPGVDSPGIDIQLVRVPFVRVSGRAVGIPKGARQMSVSASRGVAGESTPLDQDGTFQLWRLDPGKYRLNAEWTAPNGELFETAGFEVDVGDSNIDDIVLRFIPPADIPGHLEYENDAVKEMARRDLPGTLVQIAATGSEPESADSSPVAADGTFRLQRVLPDRYWLGIADEKLYVKSMRRGSMPVDGAILDLRNGAGGADLTLLVSAATGVITGSVRGESGGATGTVVVLLEASGETNFAPRLAVASADGAYAFNNVPPGSYKLVAADEQEPTIAGNQVLGYERQMDAVVVGGGEKVTRNLTRRVPE